MNALTHATSRVFPSRQSNRYTPGLHGRPSTTVPLTSIGNPYIGGAYTSGSTRGMTFLFDPMAQFIERTVP